MKTPFTKAIEYMNCMYNLPVADTPTSFPGESIAERMPRFMNVLHEEIEEGNKIVANATENKLSPAEQLTEVADLLGDIVVYAYSEAAKYGIPLDQVLEIIMASNASKLGVDGKPIYDERGKFMKGPNYWKPEPKILELLKQVAGGEVK